MSIYTEGRFQLMNWAFKIRKTGIESECGDDESVEFNLNSIFRTCFLYRSIVLCRSGYSSPVNWCAMMRMLSVTTTFTIDILFTQPQ